MGKNYAAPMLAKQWYNENVTLVKHIRKVVVNVYISIFAIYEYSIDSKSLYEELRAYKMNVTDAIKTVLVYGRIDAYYLADVIFTILKYGDAKITINK